MKFKPYLFLTVIFVRAGLGYKVYSLMKSQTRWRVTGWGRPKSESLPKQPALTSACPAGDVCNPVVSVCFPMQSLTVRAENSPQHQGVREGPDPLPWLPWAWRTGLCTSSKGIVRPHPLPHGSPDSYRNVVMHWLSGSDLPQQALARSRFPGPLLCMPLHIPSFWQLLSLGLLSS